jgi:hypothetical protein
MNWKMELTDQSQLQYYRRWIMVEFGGAKPIEITWAVSNVDFG